MATSHSEPNFLYETSKPKNKERSIVQADIYK